MIAGVGHDLVRISRIERTLERQGPRFMARCFTQAEIDHAEHHPARRAAAYAKAFAAKEACAKALGTGFRAGVAMGDIALIRDARGKPALMLSGTAQTRLAALAPAGKTARLHVTVTDEAGFAYVLVILEVT